MRKAKNNRRATRRVQVDNETIIRAYIEHWDSSAEEIAEMLGISKNTFLSRLSVLRKKGVRIPHKSNSGSGVRVDPKKLNEIVDEYEFED